MATNIPKMIQVDEKDAPKPVKATTKEASELQTAYEGFITGLGNGKVGRIEVTKSKNEEGKEVDDFRSIALSLHRAAKRIDREVEVYYSQGFANFKVKPVKTTAAA